LAKVFAPAARAAARLGAVVPGTTPSSPGVVGRSIAARGDVRHELADGAVIVEWGDLAVGAP
jgi:hypothetical protein